MRPKKNLATTRNLNTFSKDGKVGAIGGTGSPVAVVQTNSVLMDIGALNVGVGTIENQTAPRTDKETARKLWLHVCQQFVSQYSNAK